MIPYGRQEITQDDIDIVSKVLTSDFLTQGPMVPRFEQSICNFTGAHFATAVNSATSALHLACAALGLQQGDWLWTSPNTFVASASCALYWGARHLRCACCPRVGCACADLWQAIPHCQGQRPMRGIIG